jgi:hypothetical protein
MGVAVIDLAEARRLLDYSPETGEFLWKISRGGMARAGSAAGSIDTYGYRMIKVGRTAYLAHRLAFLFVEGSLPRQQVDHINGNKDDNRWTNLRHATHSQNCVNRTRPNRIGDGRRGVNRIGSRFQASISIRLAGKKKRVHLGMFGTADEAHEAYLGAARKLHGEFAP